ncbi:MAG: OmpA family protein [Saprospiraceae bacterium]|nr:OmpA family protein [Saprospiraceae bacterium]
MRLRTFALIIPSFFLAFSAWSQDTPITLTNASFEDIPRHSHVPRGWYDCGFPGESAPDTQPDPMFQVSKASQQGDTYLGMVVRDNDTWEAVSQKLSRPMEKDKCYEFSIYLARSESYISVSRITEEQANYVTPAKLRIYGGFDYCDKQYLLGETKLVINTRWIEFNFKFEPIANYTHIVLEAFYNTPTLFPYNGNLLMDNASELKPIPCEEPLVEKEPEVTPKSAEKPVVKADPPKPKPTTPAPEKKDEKPTVIEDKKISELSRADLKEGSTIRLDKLYFEVNKAVITNPSFETLDDIYTFLTRNPDVSVEIGGHTNGLCDEGYCNELSTNRAKAVHDYLVKKGISSSRLRYRGYGKTQPIAENSTVEGRKKNQRVEIKILSLNG